MGGGRVSLDLSLRTLQGCQFVCPIVPCLAVLTVHGLPSLLLLLLLLLSPLMAVPGRVLHDFDEGNAS